MALAYEGALYFLRQGLEAEFRDEIKKAKVTVTELAPGVFFSEVPQRLYWVLDYWPVKRLSFESISGAARGLRSMAKHWVYAGANAFRRGQLIADELRAKKNGAVQFPAWHDERSYCAFTLASANEILYTDRPLKGRFAGGKIRLVEDRSGPPSRAYLKLMEALLLAGLEIRQHDVVLDLGATPGGWSYVAAGQGAKVHMLDRSPPDAELLRKFPEIAFRKGDGLHPPAELLGSATVVLSDMACEPAKLYQSVLAWLAAGKMRYMICTLKFHGLSEKKILQSFAKIPGSEIYHLWHNGHELTWVWKRSDAL